MTEPVDKAGTLVRVVRTFDYRRLSQRARTAVSILAAFLFAVGTILSWDRLDVSLADLRWTPLILVIVTAPAPLFLSAWEFSATSKSLGDRVDRRTAMDVAVLGYAANFLPIPGGTILRISTLSGKPETSPGRSTHATVTVGGFWLALAGLAAGLGILVLGEPWIGFVITGGSVLVLAIAYRSARRLSPSPTVNHFIGTFLAIETAFILLAAVRTYLAFLVLDITIPPLAALVVASSSALSTAVGLAPSGLGLREGLAALLAAASGISPGAGFLASALLRVAGIAAAGTLSLVSPFLRRRRGPKGALSPEEP